MTIDLTEKIKTLSVDNLPTEVYINVNGIPELISTISNNQDVLYGAVIGVAGAVIGGLLTGGAQFIIHLNDERSKKKNACVEYVRYFNSLKVCLSSILSVKDDASMKVWSDQLYSTMQTMLSCSTDLPKKIFDLHSDSQEENLDQIKSLLKTLVPIIYLNTTASTNRSIANNYYNFGIESKKESIEFLKLESLADSSDSRALASNNFENSTKYHDIANQAEAKLNEAYAKLMQEFVVVYEHFLRGQMPLVWELKAYAGIASKKSSEDLERMIEVEMAFLNDFFGDIQKTFITDDGGIENAQ